jgi:hypothetical protein
MSHSLCPRPKMVTTSCGIKASCSQWEGSACTHEGSSFSHEGKKNSFFFFPLLSMCSHHNVPQVLKLFPQHVPNSISVLSRFGLPPSWTPLYINWKGGTYRNTFLFLFCHWGSKEMLLLGSALDVAKNTFWCWANQMWLLFKKLI